MVVSLSDISCLFVVAVGGGGGGGGAAVSLGMFIGRSLTVIAFPGISIERGVIKGERQERIFRYS